MHFITDGYKPFSQTNSTDPRQRVPLTVAFTIVIFSYPPPPKKKRWLQRHILTKLKINIKRQFTESAKLAQL